MVSGVTQWSRPFPTIIFADGQKLRPAPRLVTANDPLACYPWRARLHGGRGRS